MYADDIVLMSSSAEGLQVAINKLQLYLSEWHLELNTSKSKIIIFNKSGRKLKQYKFFFNKQDLEIVTEYRYLGTVIKASGIIDIKNLSHKGMKALFAMKQKLSSREINVEIGMKLFESMIRPIITYGSEIWGPSHIKFNKVSEDNDLESCYDKNCYDSLAIRHFKYLSHVHKNSTNLAVRGELGAYPIDIYIMVHLIKYWLHLLQSDKKSLAFKCMNEQLQKEDSHWILSIKKILYMCGFQHVWINKSTFSIEKLAFALKRKLESKYKTWWKSKIDESNKLEFYKTIKHDFSLERYLLLPLDSKVKRRFTQLRISAHRLCIEIARYSRPKLPRENRFCFSSKNAVEDKKHFLFHCKEYNSLRENLYLELGKIVGDISLHEHVLLELFTMFDSDFTPLFMEYVYNAFEHRNSVS